MTRELTLAEALRHQRNMWVETLARASVADDDALCEQAYIAILHAGEALGDVWDSGRVTQELTSVIRAAGEES